MDKLICMLIFQLLINIRKKYIEGWKDVSRPLLLRACSLLFCLFFILLRVHKIISKNPTCNTLHTC